MKIYLIIIIIINHIIGGKFDGHTYSYSYLPFLYVYHCAYQWLWPKFSKILPNSYHFFGGNLTYFRLKNTGNSGINKMKRLVCSLMTPLYLKGRWRWGICNLYYLKSSLCGTTSVCLLHYIVMKQIYFLDLLNKPV